MPTAYALPQPAPLSVLDPDSPWSMVFDQANLAIAVLSPDFDFLRVNHAFAVADGKLVDAFVGRNYFELYPHRANEAIFRRVSSTGAAYTSQAIPFAPGNNPKHGINYWDWTLTPVMDGVTEGDLSCLILMMQDVSARVRAEERARLGESDVRNLLHNLPGMVYRAYPDWSTDLVINAEPLTGFTAGEINALPGKWLDLVHPDDRASLQASDAELRTRPAEQVDIYRIVDRKGDVRWVEDHKSSLFDDEGHYLGVEGAIFDVTGRKAQEALILATEERYRNLIETSLDGFLMLDAQGSVLDANAAYCRMSGYSRSELLELRVSDLKPPGLAADTWAHMARVVELGRDIFESLHRKKDGSLLEVEVNASWRPDDGGRLFIFLRDIQRRKRADAVLATRLKLSELAANGSVEELLQTALDAAEALTGSSIGFFHFVDPDQQTLTLQTWSTNTLAHMCTAAGHNQHYPISAAGVWVDCIHQRAPVIHNDYAGLPNRRGMPAGHALVTRELTVPIVDDGRVTAVIGVGNKAGDYLAADAEVVGELAALAMDIVGRKRAEQALHASEARFRLLVEHNDIVAWEMDLASLSFTYVSPHAQELFGYDIAEWHEADFGLDANGYFKLVADDDRPRLAAAWAAALDGGMLDVEHRIVADGQLKWVHVRGEVGVDEAGTPRVAVGTVQDISEHKFAEDRLRQAAAVFEHTRDGVAIADTHANIIAVNRAYTEITGYSEADMVGRNPRLLQSGKHDAAFYRAMWADLTTNGFWQGEIWNRRKSGEIYPEWLTLSAVRNADGKTDRYIGVFTDISRIKAAEARVEFISYHDTLTGLPNRTLLNIRYQHAVERAQRRGHRLALLILDLDRFKNVNDTLGHDIGDRLLVAIAERFRGRLRDEDTLARLGGDEFAVLMEEIDEANDAAILASALLAALESPFQLGTADEIHIGASIGISVSPDDGNDPTILMRNADAAVYLAKAQGRKTFRFYTEALTAAALERVTTESRLRKAIELGHLVLHYQPLIDARSGAVIGSEALVRWNDPVEGLIPPLRFIPVAEDSGLIAPLGAWVLKEACRQMQAWLAAGRALRSIAVNLSPRQFVLQDVPELVRRTLAETGLAACYLELEITEGTLMEHGEDAITMLNRIREIGVRLSIDDFGTGYSSLSYLKRLPIDKLKIDQSFVRDISTDPNDAEIASTIIAMARSLKLSVLAEGVETAAQLAFLECHGCDYYQGYFFSRAVPAESFPHHCGERRPEPLS